MKPFFLTTLSALINRYLNLDLDSKLRLQKLKGKAITIELLPFHFIFQAIFNEEGVEISNNEWTITETKITGTPLQLFGVMLSQENRHRAFAYDLKIEGDAAFAQDVIALFDLLEIDWEEQFSHLIGDVPAYHTSKMVTRFKQTLNNIDESLTRNMSDYLHEEALLFPPPEALHDFFKEIDSLNMDVDRIEAKIKYLEKRALEDAS